MNGPGCEPQTLGSRWWHTSGSVIETINLNKQVKIPGTFLISFSSQSVWSLRNHKFETRLRFLTQVLNQSPNTTPLTLTPPQESNDGNQHPLCLPWGSCWARDNVQRKKISWWFFFKLFFLKTGFYQHSSVRMLLDSSGSFKLGPLNDRESTCLNGLYLFN